MSVPENPSAKKESDSLPLSETDRRLSSVLGLSIVSALNVACLAFLVFHYIGHQSESGMIADFDGLGLQPLPPLTRPATVVNQRHPSGLNDVSGNVELVPASKLIIGIASGIANTAPIDQTSSGSVDAIETATFLPLAATRSKGHAEHWIQLGALSKEVTATAYWSTLKKRHAALLQSRTPHYFGPNEVGGSLYHIRLGPMVETMANELCDKLRADGADCFCVRSPDNGIS